MDMGSLAGRMEGGWGDGGGGGKERKGGRGGIGVVMGKVDYTDRQQQCP